MIEDMPVRWWRLRYSPGQSPRERRLEREREEREVEERELELALEERALDELEEAEVLNPSISSRIVSP